MQQIPSNDNKAAVVVPMRVPPMPRSSIPNPNPNSRPFVSSNSVSHGGDDGEDDECDGDGKKKRKYRLDNKELTAQQKIERR